MKITIKAEHGYAIEAADFFEDDCGNCTVVDASGRLRYADGDYDEAVEWLARQHGYAVVARDFFEDDCGNCTVVDTLATVRYEGRYEEAVEWLAHYGARLLPWSLLVAQYVRAHIDDEYEPEDDDELERLFRRAYGRQPDKAEREEGLWPRLCAAVQLRASDE